MERAREVGKASENKAAVTLLAGLEHVDKVSNHKHKGKKNHLYCQKKMHNINKIGLQIGYRGAEGRGGGLSDEGDSVDMCITRD